MSKQTSFSSLKDSKKKKKNTSTEGSSNNGNEPPENQFVEMPSLWWDFKNNQGLSIHVKYKHVNEYVKKIKIASSDKVSF